MSMVNPCTKPAIPRGWRWKAALGRELHPLKSSAFSRRTITPTDLLVSPCCSHSFARAANSGHDRNEAEGCNCTCHRGEQRRYVNDNGGQQKECISNRRQEKINERKLAPVFGLPAPQHQIPADQDGNAEKSQSRRPEQSQWCYAHRHRYLLPERWQIRQG